MEKSNKIKRFNESKDETLVNRLTQYNHFLGPFNILEPMDYKQVIRSGRKPYFVNKESELVEVTAFNIAGLTPGIIDMNPDFKILLFLTDDKKDELTDLIKNIGKVKELYLKKTALLFDMVKTIVNK